MSVMRAIITILMLILVSISVTAYIIEDTQMIGSMPKVSDEVVVFLTFEDSIDRDLNSDGDTSDNIIQFYDLGTEKIKSTEHEAKDFDLFEDMIAFEDKEMIWIYNTKTKDALRTKASGSQLSIYENNIAFVTSENNVDTDLNGDGDKIDNVIRYYDLNTEEIINIRAVGTNPVVLKDYIVFETKEDLVGKDLNNDEDLDDTIIRAYDLNDRKILNTKTEGKNPVGLEKPIVIVEHEKQFWKLDLGKSRKINLGIYGNNPSLSDTAPVKLPFWWPKNSLSISSLGIAPQFTGTNAAVARGPCSWINRAAISLPEPDSPLMYIGAWLRASFAICPRRRCMVGD